MIVSNSNINNQVKNLNDEEAQRELVFYTTEEVAKMLGCSVPIARQFFHRKDFPAVKAGKNFKVEASALKKYFSERRFDP